MSTTARTTAAASAAPSPTTKKAPAAKSAARPATKAPAARAPRTPARTTAKPRGGTEALPVRAGEDPWTAEEIGEVEQDLRAEVDRLRADVASADRALEDLLRDAGTGAGDDQADTSAKNFEREHEMSILSHAREMLVQSERALGRIAGGTYGVCESCGEGVGKARLQVFPRATLCKDCKEKQERR